jgi:hypothetical protein
MNLQVHKVCMNGSPKIELLTTYLCKHFGLQFLSFIWMAYVIMHFFFLGFQASFYHFN